MMDPNSQGILSVAQNLTANKSSEKQGTNLLKSLGVKVNPELIAMMKGMGLIEERKNAQVNPANTTVAEDVAKTLEQLRTAEMQPNPDFAPIDRGGQLPSQGNIMAEAVGDMSQDVMRAMNGGLMSMSPQARMNQGLMETYRPPVKMQPGGVVRTLGQRNNNFGNIRMNPANNWLGKILDPDNESGYEQFENPLFGVRALDVLLRNYGKNDGVNTARGLVQRYAPAADNPESEGYISTDNYAQLIANATGVGVNDEIDLTDPETRNKIIPAITNLESRQDVTVDDINVARNLTEKDSISFNQEIMPSVPMQKPSSVQEESMIAMLDSLNNISQSKGTDDPVNPVASDLADIQNLVGTDGQGVSLPPNVAKNFISNAGDVLSALNPISTAQAQTTATTPPVTTPPVTTPPVTTPPVTTPPVNDGSKEDKESFFNKFGRYAGASGLSSAALANTESELSLEDKIENYQSTRRNELNLDAEVTILDALGLGQNASEQGDDIINQLSNRYGPPSVLGKRKATRGAIKEGEMINNLLSTARDNPDMVDQIAELHSSGKFNLENLEKITGKYITDEQAASNEQEQIVKTALEKAKNLFAQTEKSSTTASKEKNKVDEFFKSLGLTDPKAQLMWLTKFASGKSLVGGADEATKAAIKTQQNADIIAANKARYEASSALKPATLNQIFGAFDKTLGDVFKTNTSYKMYLNELKNSDQEKYNRYEKLGREAAAQLELKEFTKSFRELEANSLQNNNRNTSIMYPDVLSVDDKGQVITTSSFL